jgi:flavin-dependent dehydrogenase
MRRAVVIGASIGGLLAARVLSDVLDEVVLVERDELPDGPAPRSGVPHAVHAHILLRRGYLELLRLYPGIDRQLADGGAHSVDLTRDAVYITPGGEAPRFASRLRTRAASRDLFEAVIRESTLARPRVRLVAGHQAVGLVGDTSEIRGVRIARRTTKASAPGQDDGDEELMAWLVVDASGRGSHAPAWLQGVGGPAIDESVIDASLRYATRIYRMPSGPRDWKVLLVRDRPPSGTTGGGVFPLEGDRWVVTLGGAGADHPPTDDAGYLDFARTLISQRLFEAIVDAEPLTPVRGWARTANRWRHVERVERWPAGFVVVADALCALNPVYGQGMSVAMIEARAFEAWLQSRGAVASMQSGHPPATRNLVRSLAGSARLPWFMATAEDALIGGVQGVPAPGPFDTVARRYLDRIHLNAARDAHTLRRFTEVSQLVRPPVALLDPVVAWRVVRGVRATPSPAMLP